MTDEQQDNPEEQEEEVLFGLRNNSSHDITLAGIGTMGPGGSMTIDGDTAADLENRPAVRAMVDVGDLEIIDKEDLLPEEDPESEEEDPETDPESEEEDPED